MKFNCIGKIIDFRDNTAYLKLAFTDIVQQKLIEEAVNNDISLRISFTTNFRELKTYPQLKRYFAMLQMIIRSVGEVPTSENIELLDRHLKMSIFPKDNDPYGMTSETLPKLKRYLTVEEMNVVMLKIEEKYADIDFD